MTKTAYIKSPIPDEAVRSLSADISSQERMSLQGKQKRFNVGSCEVPFFVANFCFAVIVLVGEVGHKVTLPMWLDHSNATHCAESSPDNYFVLSFSSLVFVLIFGLGTLFIRVFSPKAIGEAERNFPHRLFFLVGFSDAVNGILVVFAANGTRTPPYLQSILGNFLIPLTVLFRLIILRRKPTLLKLLCSFAVVIGLFICIIPTVFPKIDHETSDETTFQVAAFSRVMWPIIFMLGSIPEATMRVFEERGVKIEDDTSNEQINLLYFLFWTSTYELLCVVLFIWVDFLPWYGDANLSNFGTKWATGFRCFFGGVGCSATPGIAGIIYILTHCLSHVGAANLLRHGEGATLLAIVMSLETPLGFLFWTLFKEVPFKWQPKGHVGTWFSIGGLAIMVPAIYIYNKGASEISVADETKHRRERCHSVNSFTEDPNPEEPLLSSSTQVTSYNSFKKSVSMPV